LKKMNVFLRLVRLFGGLGLFAFGICLTVQANVGLGPWDAFHQGISKNAGITFGQASIMVSVILVIINILLGEKIGWGTLADMACVGLFVDLILFNHILPPARTMIWGILMVCAGVLLMGFAVYLYVSSALGCGPRDGLMVGLAKKTNRSAGLVRSCMELIVLAVGYLLGGSVGIGTVIYALGIGFSIQLAFKICKSEIREIEHRFISEDIKWLKATIQKKYREN
jgi:uncharacterized membrane protein YczE